MIEAGMVSTETVLNWISALVTVFLLIVGIVYIVRASSCTVESENHKRRTKGKREFTADEYMQQNQRSNGIVIICVAVILLGTAFPGLL